MSQESKVSFEDYSWDEDEEWQILIKKLEFPGSFDETKKQKHILKRKQKYFKEKVDPEFTIASKSKPKPQTEPPQPSNEENPHDPSTKNSQSQPAKNPSKPEPTTNDNPSSDTTHTSSQTSANANQSQNSGASYTRPSYASYQPPPTRIGQLLSPLLNYYYLLSQWFVCVSCVLSLASRVWYYRALYATIVMYIINTVQSNGRPQLSMYYAQRVMQDENIMIAIYGAIFLMGNPFVGFLAPLLLRSLFMGTYLLNGLLGSKVPALYHKTRPLFQKILTKRGWFNETIALCEVLMGVFLIFACFFMSKTVILTFIYWQIMHARYMMSRMIQYAFGIVHGKIQSVLARIPFLLNLYLKFAAMLWNMVDPQKLQQQMSGGADGQSGGATGMMAGMLKKCSVM